MCKWVSAFDIQSVQNVAATFLMVFEEFSDVTLGMLLPLSDLLKWMEKTTAVMHLMFQSQRGPQQVQNQCNVWVVGDETL